MTESEKIGVSAQPLVKGESRTPGQRRKLAVMGLLLLLGIGGGAAIRKLVRAPHSGGKTAGTASHFQGAGFTSEVATAWSRLLDVLRLPGAHSFGFDRFATLLLGHEEPAALAFFKDYSDSPELMKTWNDFKARRNEKGIDAYWFAHKLSESEKFASLLNQHAQDPAFVAFGEKVTQELSAAVLASGATGVAKDKDIAMDKFALANPDDLAAKGASTVQDSGSGGYKLGAMKKLDQVSGSVAFTKFDSLFSKGTLTDAQRGKVVNSLLKGDSIQTACANANASAQCLDAYRKCQADPACGKSITQEPSASANSAAPGTPAGTTGGTLTVAPVGAGGSASVAANTGLTVAPSMPNNTAMPVVQTNLGGGGGGGGGPMSYSPGTPNQGGHSNSGNSSGQGSGGQGKNHGH
ncbi:MAG: hypothetical protein NTX64_06430 [Elusimicrobia bacterium]|nr:hypothetical protein [Elusimicrobiota bacterium]